MAETVLMDGYQVSSGDWVWDTWYGLWTATIPRFCALTVGERYSITCGGTRYEPTLAYDITSQADRQMIAIGDLALLDLPTNGSVYAMGDDGTNNILALTARPREEAPGSYTFSVSHIPKSQTIVLKDQTGNDVLYDLPQRLRLDTADGGTVGFVREDSASSADTESAAD